MRYIMHIFLFLCCFAAFDVRAQLVTANTDGKLEAAIVLSDDPNFIKEWFRESNGAPHMQRLENVHVGQKLTAAFLVSGMKLDDKRNCRATVSFKLTQPDGKVMLAQDNYAKIDIPASQGFINYLSAFVMADPALDLLFEDKDAKGQYTLTIDVVDEMSQQKATVQHTFTLQ